MRVLPSLLVAGAIACALVACGGETMSIGSNPNSDELHKDACPRFDEPPLEPGYCGGNYAPSYDEAGCKVGYHCTHPEDGGTEEGGTKGGSTSKDQGNANADCKPPMSPLGLTCTYPNQEVPLYATTGCVTSFGCGQILIEANDGQTAYVPESGTTFIFRLQSDGAKGGKWSASAATTALLGADTTFYEPPSAGSPPGALGHQIISYHNVPREGTHPTTLLEFSYALPNTKVSKTLSVWLR